MSTLQVDTLQGTDGSPKYTARAWVNFNGTGVVAIRASGNVSSITDNGVGNYTVNFSTPMPDTNYCVIGSNEAQGNYPSVIAKYVGGTLTTSAVQVWSADSQVGVHDDVTCSVAIFR